MFASITAGNGHRDVAAHKDWRSMVFILPVPAMAQVQPKRTITLIFGTVLCRIERWLIC
jgi:hypothetical protein